jgi:hypothetical protein
MTTKTKNIIIFLVVPTVLVVGYFGFKFIKKRINAATKEDLDKIIGVFEKSGSKVFRGMTDAHYQKFIKNIQKKMTKDQAAELIDIGVIENSKWSEEQRVKVLNYLPLIIGATNVMGLGNG